MQSRTLIRKKNYDFNLAQMLLGKLKFELVDWPTNSCDLNPQENVWSMMDKINNKELEITTNISFESAKK